jgi:GntR family transcriptional regulator
MLMAPDDGLSKADLNRSAVPRYLQLAAYFRGLIDSGHWPIDTQIPTVEALMATYGVARSTIRQAIGLVEQEGLVARFRAKGTFVRRRSQDILWCEVETDWSGLLRHREGARIELIDELDHVEPNWLPQSFGAFSSSYRRVTRRHWRNETPFLLANCLSIARSRNKYLTNTTRKNLRSY